VKKQDPDLGYESGMNNPYHVSESLETIFWVEILKFFDVDPGSGIQDDILVRIRIRSSDK
jgi:hypothetical protein